MELCPRALLCLKQRVCCSLAAWWFPYCHLLLSFQVGIFLAKDEMNRLRQEKQVLKKELEEVKKRVLWEDPVMVTECVGTWVHWQGV